MTRIPFYFVDTNIIDGIIVWYAVDIIDISR